MKAEKYLCVRDFGVGYGGKISGYERALTDVCENFRMQGGTLCDLYGVNRKVVLPEKPLCIYPMPAAFGEGAWLFLGGQGLCLFREADLSFTQINLSPYLGRCALGERLGKPAVAFPYSGGLGIVSAGDGENAPPVLTEIHAGQVVDAAFLQGRWVMLNNQGSLVMTKPYEDGQDALTELIPPTLGQVRRIFVSEDRLILLTARSLYVLSGVRPEEFTLTAVPVPETLLWDSAATDGKTLYFLTEKSVFSYRGGTLSRVAKLPYSARAEGSACALVKDGTYYFACDTERGKREGIYDPEENAAYLGAGRGITSFAEVENGGESIIAVSYGRAGIGALCEECVVDGAPLPKLWRSRPTDFGRLNAYKILTGVAVWSQGKGRLRIQSERGACCLPLTQGDNAKRLTLTGVRFVMEITCAYPGARFVKPVITFTEGGT